MSHVCCGSYPTTTYRYACRIITTRRRLGSEQRILYVRGHRPGGRYKGHYTAATLRQWAERINAWKNQGCDVYVYFDNDQKSAAPADALRLREFLGMRRLMPQPNQTGVGRRAGHASGAFFDRGPRS